MSRFSLVSYVAVAALAGSAMAQFSPTIAETTGLNTPFRSAARQHQSYYNQSVLPSTTATITGVQFRLFADPAQNGAGSAISWPAAPLSASNFTVTLGRPSAAITTDGEIVSTTTTFAANMLDAVVLYSGPLTIPAGAFPNDGTTTTPASWGLTVNFSSAYTYNPGDGLMLYISHTGFTGASVFFAAGSFANGVADAVSSTASATAPAPNGFSNPLIVNFVPTPGAAALLGLGGLAMTRRRR